MRIQHLDKNTKMNLLEDLLKRSPNNYGKYEQGVAEILDHVRSEKDAAVFAYTEKFDGAKIDASNIKVTEEEIKEAYELVGEELTGIIRKAYLISVIITRDSVKTAGLRANRMEQCLDRKLHLFRESASMYQAEKLLIRLLSL